MYMPRYYLTCFRLCHNIITIALYTLDNITAYRCFLHKPLIHHNMFYEHYRMHTHTHIYTTLLQHSAILWVNNGQLRTSLGDLSIKSLATYIEIIHVTAVTYLSVTLSSAIIIYAITVLSHSYSSHSHDSKQLDLMVQYKLPW